MIWKECIPIDFYMFICEKDNFSYLNSKNVLKSQYLVAFKEYKDKKKENVGTDLKSYKNREKISFEERKPISIDDFTKEEEERILKKIKSRKQKRHAVAEINKELKRKKKQSENAEKEKKL